MYYSTFVPNPMLTPWIECYWAVKGIDTSIQKIIPDGYSELIFHLGDPYNLVTGDTAASQSPSIIAGQISKPIFLQPQGNSDVVGIKFKPTGLWRLTGLRMIHVANEAVDFSEIISPLSAVIYQKLFEAEHTQDRMTALNQVLLSWFYKSRNQKESVDHLIHRIQKSNGSIAIRELSSSFKLSTRKIERLFQEQVGISAKQYSRLVRFNHVFQLIQQPDLTKVDISFLAGYFDQSHFNNEFREFTGESPERYFDQNHVFANFFMNR
jgi:AraC-like DNA-binding protein